MLFFLLFLAVLFVPGYLLATVTRTREYGFLVSITLSYFCFIFLGALSAELELSIEGLAVIYGIVVSLLLILAAVLFRKGVLGGRHFVANMFSESLNLRTVMFVVAAVGVYHLVVGYYDEVPADLYQHLRNTRRESMFIVDGFRSDFSDILNLRYSGKYWYHLVSSVAIITGTSLFELYPYVLVTCAMVFLVAVALCADRLFRPFRFSPGQHQVAVVLAVFFVFTQMGINVISYVRYYSYAPSMLNFVVYFTGLVCALNLFEKQDNAFRSVLLLLIAIWVSYLVHEQEAVFIVLACTLLLIWRCLEIIWNMRHLGIREYLLPLSVLLILIVGGIAAYADFRLDHEFRPLRHNRIIPLPFTLPLFGQPYILDPAYQFIRVVTIWGVAVYVLFLFHLKLLSRQPLLVLGMLSPILTVFNPVFVDIFIRLGQANTLWRLCYFIPLHFVAAAVVVLLWSRMRAARLQVRALSAASILAMFVLLLPSLVAVPVNSYAKTTLARVGDANRLEFWWDVVEFLEGMDKRYKILTDPVTGFMVTAFTRHQTFQYKFLPSRAYYRYPFVFDSYDQFPLSRYSGMLLVVNNRNGGPSRTGELSNHWHKDVLRISDYYSQELTTHLESYPDKFKKLWSQNRVSVYLIR
jgi:hypothetical protein